jgi:drug/metabolite transporter (DMT)-like permease
MKLWLILGLVASLLYGVSAILFKLLTSERYLAGRPGWVLFGIGTGIALCGLLAVLFWPTSSPNSDATVTAYLWAVPTGLLNGFATLLVLWLMRSPSTNLSQLVPVYNTNTLVAFVLAVIFFHELPTHAELFRNLAGALLIVAGTTLIGIR